MIALRYTLSAAAQQYDIASSVPAHKAAAAFNRGKARCRRARSNCAYRYYGSLALTGKGHGTDKAVIQGLAGELPATVDPDAAEALVANVRARGWFQLPGFRQIAFDPKRDIIFDGTSGPIQSD
jgi:hypothetical protein